MSTRKYNKKRSGAGFTLIELLIVMGALVTLMGMILVVAPGLTDNKAGRAKADIRLLMLALEDYADANGGVYPPNELPPEVIVSPSIEEDEKMKWEMETSAALFYFLTRQFFFRASEDPQFVGKRRLGGHGPFLEIDNLMSDHLANPALLKDREIVVYLGESGESDESYENGHTGKTTWLKDPWENPYRYIVYDNLRRYVIESAGPDGEFGAEENDPASEAEKEKGRDNVRSDLLSR